MPHAIEKSRHASNEGAIYAAKKLAAANPGKRYRARRGDWILWDSAKESSDAVF